MKETEILTAIAGLLGGRAGGNPPIPQPGSAPPPPHEPTVSLSAILGLLALLAPFLAKLSRSSEPGPAPVPAPTVGGGPRLDDDEDIPEPKPIPNANSFAGYTLTARIQKAQFQAKRFPLEYTDQNPMGLMAEDVVRKIERGEEALPYGSKLWLDLTLRTPEGRELGGDELVARGLAWTARHEIAYPDGTVAFMQGRGNNGEGAEENQIGIIGWGGASWAKSHGMNLAAKAFGEGSFTFTGELAGIRSNTLKIRVS